jgi:transglutaminase-like putative cysteine protease
MKSPLLRRLVLAGVLAGASCTLAQAQAQTEPLKFGKIDELDLTPQNFVADSSAAAVVLGDIGRTHFEYSDGQFKVVFERTTRLKILTKAGYDYATVAVPLYHKNTKEEKLSGLKGFTYNLVNGQVVKEKLNADAIFREETTPNVTTRKFTLPNVRVGSVIEYTYTVFSPFTFNFQDWTFQRDIPIRWSEYRADIPEYFDYKMLMQGYEPLAVQERKEATTQYNITWSSSMEYGQRTSGGSQVVTPRVTNYRWAMKNVPALREEPYMTTTDDYVAKIDFELAGVKWPDEPYKSVADSWEKIDKELLDDESLGRQLNRGSFLKEQLTAVLAQHTEPAARVAAIHDLVRRSVKHNGSNGLYSSGSVRRAYDQKSGNAADINLLLIAALREAGFQADPVLLSTRSHGRIDTSVPLISRFNYVLAHVKLPDASTMLVDATEELAPCGMLPSRCLSGVGRLLLPQAGASQWVKLEPADRLKQYSQIQLTVDEKGGLSGKVHQEHSGYLALAQRERLRKLGEKKYVEELVAGHDGWNIPTYAFKEQNTLHKPLTLEYEFTAAGSEAPAGTIYLSPLHDFGTGKNPFLHENRRFPVDFGTKLEETLMVNLTLPAGYELEETPRPVVVELPEGGGRFSYMVQPGSGSVQIVSRMNLTRPVYSAEEYAHLREFFSRMMSKQSEQLVLKKKS